VDESLQHQLQEAMAEFTKTTESLTQARDEIAQLSVTARSKDGAVEVTVGAQGEPTGLRFLNDKHKTLSGQQLATSVLAAMAAARQEIADQVAARFEEVSGRGMGVAGSVLEGLDLDKLLEPLRAEGLLTDAPAAKDRSEGANRRA
jgi:DNA-binding protein YbaB